MCACWSQAVFSSGGVLNWSCSVSLGPVLCFLDVSRIPRFSADVFRIVVSSWLTVPLIRMNFPLSFLICFGLKSILL